MDQYLLQILKETKTIIIPQLGALTITNATTGELMFMPFLKHDDGKLSAHIAEKEGIEENEAKNIIAKYVREINSTLDQGDSYKMFQFGTFTKGSDGDVEFENWDGESAEAPKAAAEVVEEPKVETPEPEVEKKTTKEKAPKAEEVVAEVPKEEMPEQKVEKVSKEEKTPNVAEVIPEVKKVETPKPKVENKEVKETATAVVEAEPKIEKPIEPVKEIKNEEPKTETPQPKAKAKTEDKPTPPKVSVVSGTSVPKKEMNIAEQEELTKSVKKLEKLKKDKEDGKKKKKRGVGFYMLMVILALIVAGGTYFALNYNELKQHVPFLADTKEKKVEKEPIDNMKDMIGEEEVEESQDDPETSEIDEENSEVVEEPIEEEVEEPIIEPVVSNSNGGSFHIVAGSFSSADNANRLVEKIKAAGYPATTIQRGAQTIVSVQSFATKAEAQAAVASVQDVAPKGWVLEWR